MSELILKGRKGIALEVRSCKRMYKIFMKQFSVIKGSKAVKYRGRKRNPSRIFLFFTLDTIKRNLEVPFETFRMFIALGNFNKLNLYVEA